jgi:hypothetical protein
MRCATSATHAVPESRRRFEERQGRFFPRAQRQQLQEALARFSGRDPLHLLEDVATSTPQSAPRASHRTAQEKARKHKNKRKIESASRKANRRKRK